MDYQTADDLFFELLQEQGTPMFERLRTTAFPQTYRAMFGFCARTNVLKTALFDMIESDNPYAFNALFRCFCEHYLKAMYVFVRFVTEQSDEPGREYFAFCGAREARQYAAAVVDAEKLLGNEVVAEMTDVFKRVYPDAVHLSSPELQQRSGKFEYRAILKFLSEHPRVLGPENPFLARILPRYSRLSSFVHGGPNGEREMRAYEGPEALEQCRTDAGLAFLMAASVVLVTALMVGKEYPEHLQFVANLDALLKEYARPDTAPPDDAPPDDALRVEDDDLPF